MTLQKLQDNIAAYIKANPKAAHYPVIDFDYYRQRSYEVEPITQHHYLVDNGLEELIYDSVEEMEEDEVDVNSSVKKVILL